MLFSSYTFIIIFLPFLIILYYLMPDKWRNYILLAASIVFYAWGGPKHLPAMLISIAINYVCGILVDYYRKNTSLQRITIVVAIILNLSLLGYYKYMDFFIENYNTLTGAGIPLRHILLPIGISFYTFQGLSYVLDLRLGQGHVLKNPLKLALYISFFPQLIAGPIVRYKAMESQINNRIVDCSQINGGIYRFIIGLSKKILLANILGEYTSYCFSLSTSDLTIVSSWTGSLAYSLQIYYDFSGYSDMAIGLGAVFGFSLPENFNYPYVSKSITEFWRRWHISLSTWFRDYVYIPLGGNRKGVTRQYINILIVWFLTGLWHGSSWNFVIWGLYYALLLIIEKGFRSLFPNPNTNTVQIRRVFGRVYTFIAVTIGWILFESSTADFAFEFISKLFDFSYKREIWGMQLYHVLHEYGIILAIGCLFATPIHSFFSSQLETVLLKRFTDILKDVIMVILFLLCFVRIVAGSYDPFIYFRF